MAFDFTLTNGMKMYFNGKPAVDKIEGWVIFAKLKQEVMDRKNREEKCPLCEHQLYYCDCLKIAANDILHEILKDEINNINIKWE